VNVLQGRFHAGASGRLCPPPPFFVPASEHAPPSPPSLLLSFPQIFKPSVVYQGKFCQLVKRFGEPKSKSKPEVRGAGRKGGQRGNPDDRVRNTASQAFLLCPGTTYFMRLINKNRRAWPQFSRPQPPIFLMFHLTQSLTHPTRTPPLSPPHSTPSSSPTPSRRARTCWGSPRSSTKAPVKAPVSIWPSPPY
jgi:hypothetical protein